MCVICVTFPPSWPTVSPDFWDNRASTTQQAQSQTNDDSQSKTIQRHYCGKREGNPDWDTEVALVWSLKDGRDDGRWRWSGNKVSLWVRKQDEQNAVETVQNVLKDW